ncbi:unnamed protein product [Urochloa humidicola]
MVLAGLGGEPAGFASSSFDWCQMASATVWTKIRGGFDYLLCKDSKSAKIVEEREARRNIRIDGFLSISSLGLIAMFCGGAAQVFKHVKTNHPKQALYCVVYLTFTVLCQLIGLIAVTFPSEFPWAFFMAGLGEWQSAIFVLALFHLDIMEYYGEFKHAEYSMVAASVIVSFYFYLSHGCRICPQDPMFLHFTGKMLIRTVYILCSVMGWTLFLIAKLLAFMVWFPFFLLSILLSFGGYSKSPGKKGQLSRLFWHIRND